MTKQQSKIANLMAQTLTAQEGGEIVNTATQVLGLVGTELHYSLIASGINLAMERMQGHVVDTLEAHMGIIRSTLKSLDASLQDAQGDDDQVEFIHSLRSPIVAQVQAQVDSIADAVYAKATYHSGAPSQIIRSTVPAAQMPDDDLHTVGASAMFADQEAFFGFVLQEFPMRMECPCPSCLSNVFSSPSSGEQKTSAELVALAHRRFGSTDKALTEYGRFYMHAVQTRVQKNTSNYGSLDMQDVEGVSSAVSSLMSRISGNTIPPAHNG